MDTSIIHGVPHKTLKKKKKIVQISGLFSQLIKIIVL